MHSNSSCNYSSTTTAYPHLTHVFLCRCSPYFLVLYFLTCAASCLYSSSFPSCTFLYLSYFLEPLALSGPFLSIFLAGWASWELRLTSQLHFDLWPCCCRLLHLGHNSTCHSPTFHPLCSVSHPPITTLVSFVRHIPGLYRLFSKHTHSLHSAERDGGEKTESAIVEQNFGFLHLWGMWILVFSQNGMAIN